MKFSNLLLIILFWVISFSTLPAQNYDHDALTSQTSNNFNIPSLSSFNQDWEVLFTYDLLDEIGISGFGGIVYDQYWDELWISSWGNEYFEILSLTDTSLTELTSFVIDSVSNIRGMTTDGEFVYAGNASDTIKIIDLLYNFQGEIIAPINVRYIAYDPEADAGNGGFWIGNWTADPTLIDKNGNILRTLDYNNLGASNIYGGVYDNYSDGGPYLWLWERGLGGGNPQNIIQIDIASGLPTGISHDVMLDVGADRDSSVAGGLFITDKLFSGKIILGGILQGGGDRLFGYDISPSIIITAPPTVITKSASNISATSATLNGTLNPNGKSTIYNFELGTSISYGTTITNSDLFTGIFDTDVSDEVTDLLPNTTYHYRLVATNSDGTEYGDDVEFTTNSETILSPTVVTTPATNIGSSSATLNGTVNPNESSTSYAFEYGTTTSYGSTVSNGTNISGNVAFVVHYDLTSLSANTTYHYRIIATNAGGTTLGNDITFTTNSTNADIDLEWRTLSSLSFDWEIGSLLNSELLVRNNGTTSSGAHESQLYLSVDDIIESSDIALGNQISFPSIPAGDSVSVSTSFLVPSITKGIYYFGAIVDINNAVLESNEENNNYFRKGKIIVGYPNTIQLNSSVTFNDPTLTSSFRMIGIPGDNNQSISQLLNGNFNEDWVSYYDNGNTTNYLVSYDGSNTFNFSPGKGFWILSKNNINVSQNVNVVTLENNWVSSGSYEIGYPISLHNGWNIISNPFESDVIWSAVQDFNLVTESIHSFNGSFSTSTVMEPFMGYYFYNATNLSELHIPYFVSNNLAKEVPSSSNNGQYLKLSTIFKENRKSSVIIGHNENALNSYDSYDRFAPPGDFEDVRISILNQEIETPYKYLKTDYRKLDKNQTFDLIIKKGIIDKLELKVKGVSSLSAEAIYLVDQNITFHDLRSKEKIILKSSRENINLKLLIGDYEYIENNREILIPGSISLNQNYPNPFNPITTIEYSLPEKSSVQLKVFDILGKEITTLVNGEITPGKYEVIFQGTELTSGVYFYTLRIGDFIETKKMLLLK